MKKAKTDFTAICFYSILYRRLICVLPLVVTPYTVRSVIARIMVIAGVFSLVKNQDDLFIYTLVLALCFMLEHLSLFCFLFREVDWGKNKLL